MQVSVFVFIVGVWYYDRGALFGLTFWKQSHSVLNNLLQHVWETMNGEFHFMYNNTSQSCR